LALEADMDEMEILTMSSKELNRLEILGRVLVDRNDAALQTSSSACSRSASDLTPSD